MLSKQRVMICAFAALSLNVLACSEDTKNNESCSATACELAANAETMTCRENQCAIAKCAEGYE